MLMGVAQNCIGAQSNKPVMGIVQDSLLGLHRMSASDVVLDHAHACRIIGRMRHNPRTLPRPAVTIHSGADKKRFWTGKQLISQLIDPVVYIEMDHDLPGDPHKASDWSDDLPVVVMKGTIVSGILRKAHVGTGAGGIVDTITRELGGVAAMRFMGDAQRITHEFLLQRGHHVGIDDVMLSSDGHKRVTERLDKATRLCEEIQREMTAGDMSEDHRHMGERAILRILSKTLLQTGSIVNEYMKDTNAIKRMVGAGSKGTFINMSQICAALGQQSLEGSRIVAEKGTRTLPCFPHNDITLASRGMVQNSFSLGLSPPELFFHAIGGREGLVDTAVKTSQSGYIQRRMNKSMEDNTVHSCGRLIRNSINEVVSFQWGSDGFHPARVERVKLTFLTGSIDDMVSAVHPRAVDMAKRARELCMQVKNHVLSGTDDGIDARVLLPFNPVRIRRRIQRELMKEETHITEEVTTELLVFLRDMPQVMRLSLLDLFRPEHLRRLPMTSFRSIFEIIRYRTQHALSIAGESVGCIAAQSIGEPCTQLTLNTFHNAGNAAKNVTLGIPRFKELLDATKSPKTPCTTIRFHAPYNTSERFAEYMANTMPMTRLGDVVQRCDIVHDPDPSSTTIAEDEWIVLADSILGYEMPSHATAYVVRIVLNQDVMRMRHMTPTIVRRILSERLATRAHVSSSEVNAVDWVVRIRFFHVRDMLATGHIPMDQESLICHRALNVLLETVLVCGHHAITGASLGFAQGEHLIHAYGNVLMDCCAADSVDWTRCTSNDVWEVLNTLGIEACAHVLFEQMKAVVSFDGTYVDDRHILMIVDSICRGGSIMPLNRHGINRTETSPLMRCSFEETTDILCEAAGFAQAENARGVSTCIMTGQTPHMGTGTVDVLFPVQSERLTVEQCKPQGRVMRSTCRSYVKNMVEENLEYVMDPQRPTTLRPLSPPTLEGSTTRKRARFRMASPDRKR